ncbi:hypothetical protein Patl1_30006 [Pistacia atlantica]|uniref:Uncharacterized protein n=1 Tax=Pistacia atlantica TaxID=434234 RepID=A0ACC1AAD9_9ROSI|nr:hypothetical protein Patl1_30006 [Pistacia atlantica]
MAVNPACLEPGRLLGHTDPNAFTILLQDFQVSGLQFLKDDEWTLSNGRYKSAWHRAILNADKCHPALPFFYHLHMAAPQPRHQKQPAGFYVQGLPPSQMVPPPPQPPPSSFDQAPPAAGPPAPPLERCLR